MAKSESVSQRLLVLEEERLRVAKSFHEAVSNESNFRRNIQHLTAEDERLANFVETADALCMSATRELTESEEAFLKAQTRLEQVRRKKKKKENGASELADDDADKWHFSFSGSCEQCKGEGAARRCQVQQRGHGEKVG